MQSCWQHKDDTEVMDSCFNKITYSLLQTFFDESVIFYNYRSGIALQLNTGLINMTSSLCMCGSLRIVPSKRSIRGTVTPVVFARVNFSSADKAARE